MTVQIFPTETDRPFNKTVYATAKTDVISNADANATMTSDQLTVDPKTGDLAVAADRGSLLIYDGTKWREKDGGLQGQTPIPTDNVAAAVFTMNVPTTLTALGGILDYVVVVHNGTAVQMEVGSTPFGAVNEAGTVTPTIKSPVTDVAADTGGGTNAVTFSAAAVGTLATFSVKADTSLTITAAYIKWRVRPINGTGSSPTLALP